MKHLARAAWPDYFHGGCRRCTPQTEVRSEIALRELAAARGDFPNLRSLPGGEAYAGSQSVSIAFCSNQLEIDEMVSPRTGIAQNGRRIPIVGHDNVDAAVIVEVRESDSAACARFENAQAGGRGSLLEFSVSLVVEQRVVL